MQILEHKMNSIYNLCSAQQRLKIVIILVICVFLITTHQLSSSARTDASNNYVDSVRRTTPREQARNSTLGFQKILALSPGPSWRTRGMKAAAELAGLDISVPGQPFTSDDIIRAYQNLGATNVGKKRLDFGSAKAWLAHLDLIKFAVASHLNSVLIIEDDVDWDVTIRDQMALLSDNIRAFQDTDESDISPYGSSWDVLWVGHCGEVTEKDTVKMEYQDESLIPTQLYAGWTKKYLVNIQEGNRAVQKTKQTVCTFGYGLSSQGLRNVLNVVSHAQDEAFDVAMMRACQQEQLKCISVNPELMHHYNPKDGTGYVSPNMEANGWGHSSDESVFETLKGTTANMKNSARCAALFHETCLQPPTRAEDY